MALEALDDAMDLMYSPDAAAAAVDGGSSTPSDPLDVFLGSLLPGADVGNVDAYIEEIMGPGAERQPARPAIDVKPAPAEPQQSAMEHGAVASDPEEAVDDTVDLFEEDWDIADVADSSAELLDVEL